MVGERQRLTDTTIISDSWTTFYAAIAKGYSCGRSQAERRKKVGGKVEGGRGDARESDDGLIECIQIFPFSLGASWRGQIATGEERPREEERQLNWGNETKETERLRNKKKKGRRGETREKINSETKKIKTRWERNSVVIKMERHKSPFQTLRSENCAANKRLWRQ